MDEDTKKNADTGSNPPPAAAPLSPSAQKPALPEHPIPPELPEGHRDIPQTPPPAATPAATPSVPPVAPPSSPPSPPLRAAPQSAALSAEPSRTAGPFREDIGKILKDIKLPERRSSEAVPSTATARTDIEKNTPSASGTPEPVIVSEVTKQKEAIPPQAPPVHAPPLQQKPPVAPVSAVPPVVKPPEPSVIEKNIVTPLRTLKEDLQNVVREKKISLVHAVALEEEKKKDRRLQPTPAEIAAHRQKSRRTFAVLFAMGVLFFLGAAALIGVYTIQSQRAGGLAVPKENSVLFAEQSFSLLINNQSANDVKRILAQARGSTNATLGSITRIVPMIPVNMPDGSSTERLATTEEFLKAIGVRAPDDLYRSLSSQFFFGIHTVDKNAPLIVIPVLSYDHAFAGMLAWEKTMNADLAPAFTHVAQLAAGENGLPVDRPFQDVVMRNYDARALRDDTGAIQLYYSFPTPHILIIAESPYSFTEILSRLQADRKL